MLLEDIWAYMAVLGLTTCIIWGKSYNLFGDLNKGNIGVACLKYN